MKATIKSLGLKAKINFIITFLSSVNIIMLQGCGSIGDLGDWSFSESTTTTSTVVIPHFDKFNKLEYLSSPSYNESMPFNMRSHNMVSPLLKVNNETLDDALSNKYYLNISGSYSFKGGDIQISFSPVKNILVIGSISSLGKSSAKSETASVPTTTITTTTTTWGGWFSGGSNTYVDTINANKNYTYQKEFKLQQNHRELAAGYYNSIGKHGIWQITAGFGAGSAVNSYTYSGEPFSGETFSESRNYFQTFLKNDIGYSTKVTEGAICARLTYQRFTSQTFTGDYEIPNYEMEKVNLLLEPALHFGAGNNNFRIFSEYGFAIPLG